MLSWIGIRAAKSCKRINAQHAPGSVTEGSWLVRQRNSRSSTLLIRVMDGGVAQEFSRRLTMKAIKPSEPARATNRAIVIYSQRWVACNSRLCRPGSHPHTERKHPAKPTTAGPCAGRARIRRPVQHLHQFPATTWGQGIHIGPSIGWILLCHVQLPSP